MSEEKTKKSFWGAICSIVKTIGKALGIKKEQAEELKEAVEEIVEAVKDGNADAAKEAVK
jgi:hypothetical protein